MYVASITTCNLQSHLGPQTIELPPSGLIRFQGENSDGKSVLTKATYDMISCSISNPKIRKRLINYGCNHAYLSYLRSDGMRLTMYVTKESSGCYYLLERPDGTKVHKTILEKGLEDLVKEFGFHYDKKRDFSLNVYQTYDPLLLVNTGGPTSYDIIQCAITDENAATAIENMQTVQKELRAQRDRIMQGIQYANAELSRLVFYDEKEEMDNLKSVTALIADLKVVQFIPIDEDIMEPVDLTDLLILENVDAMLEDDTHLFSSVNDNLIFDLERLYVIGKLIDVAPEIEKYNELQHALEENVCPTCNRSFADELHHTH